MKKQYDLNANNFSKSVKNWSYKKFISTFKNIYPLDELQKISVHLGIKYDGGENRLLGTNNEQEKGGSVTN
jgi:hypothetical protein